MRTIGLSPKVSAPTLLGVAVGFGLVLAGERDVGVPVILAALGLGGVGAAAGPGEVDVEVGEASDVLLAPALDTQREIEQ